jgi:hypothetical protein
MFRSALNRIGADRIQAQAQAQRIRVHKGDPFNKLMGLAVKSKSTRPKTKNKNLNKLE